VRKSRSQVAQVGVELTNALSECLEVQYLQVGGTGSNSTPKVDAITDSSQENVYEGMGTLASSVPQVHKRAFLEKLLQPVVRQLQELKDTDFESVYSTQREQGISVGNAGNNANQKIFDPDSVANFAARCILCLAAFAKQVGFNKDTQSDWEQMFVLVRIKKIIYLL
jgi:hypothetical protein